MSKSSKIVKVSHLQQYGLDRLLGDKANKSHNVLDATVELHSRYCGDNRSSDPL